MSKIVFTPNASGTGNFTITSPNSNTNRQVDLPDAAGGIVIDSATQTLTNKTLTSPTITGASMSSMASSVITSVTANSSISGSSTALYTGIPSWVKRITLILQNVSPSGTSGFLIQIGSGSITSSGYVSTSFYGSTTSVNHASSTAGFVLSVNGSAASIASGWIQLVNITGNTWVASGWCKLGTTSSASCMGEVALSGVLDRIQLTMVTGSETFDSGTINILYE